ncbi:MAG: hypothetical protein M3M85_02510 [bacterium]|nr:hypothetical protein [bacterium]
MSKRFDEVAAQYERLQNTPTNIAVPDRMNDGSKSEVGQEIVRALRHNFITLFYSPEFHGLMDKLRKACDSEEEMAPAYRGYLVGLNARSKKKPSGPGRIVPSRENRPADIAELEEVFYNERDEDFNPFSGFVCHLAEVDEGRWGSTIDSLLDPGGP